MLELLSKVILSTWFVALCINELQLTHVFCERHTCFYFLININQAYFSDSLNTRNTSLNTHVGLFITQISI
jgi:hypothetical protein